MRFSSNTGDNAMAYYGSAPTTSPSTIGGVVEAACSAFHPYGTTVPTTLRVPRMVLFENDYRWWRTTGSVEPYQGRIYAGSTAATSWNAEIRYVIQFCGPTYSSAAHTAIPTINGPRLEEKGEDYLSTSEEPEIIAHGDSQHPTSVARDVPRSASGTPVHRNSSYDRGYPPLPARK